MDRNCTECQRPLVSRVGGRGLCGACYQRNRKHGTLPNVSTRPPARPLALRFWSKVDKGAQGECWIWLAALSDGGYGSFEAQRAHRVAYEISVGPIPAGLEIDHLCRTRACVNPQHLEPVTRSENLRRAWAARKAVSA